VTVARGSIPILVTMIYLKNNDGTISAFDRLKSYESHINSHPDCMGTTYAVIPYSPELYSRITTDGKPEDEGLDKRYRILNGILKKIRKETAGTDMFTIPIRCGCGFMGTIGTMNPNDKHKIHCPKCGKNSTNAIQIKPSMGM